MVIVAKKNAYYLPQPPLFGQSTPMPKLILQLLYHQPFDIFLSHGKLFV
jgi:hypothetical protein